MNLSEKAQAKALKKAEALRKEWEDAVGSVRSIYGVIGGAVYNLSKEGKIEVPQINDYLTKIDEVFANNKKLIKLIEERGFKAQFKIDEIVTKDIKLIEEWGFKIQSKHGHYELITIEDTIICTCGVVIGKDDKFCRSCGRKVEELIAEPSKVEQTPVKECICDAKIQVGQLSEKARAEEYRKEAEELRKELEDDKDEDVKICRIIGEEVYKLYKAGKIDVSQIDNRYLTAIDAYNSDSEKLIERIEKLGFTIQEKQGHYELVTIKSDKLKDTIICTCGAEVSKNSKFCSSCGKKVEELIAEMSKAEQTPVKDKIICSCGAEVSRNSKFCSSCGKKVEELITEPSKAEQVPVKECICGAKIQPGQFMCLECGRKIE